MIITSRKKKTNKACVEEIDEGDKMKLLEYETLTNN
jgi:hypothetical protein